MDFNILYFFLFAVFCLIGPALLLRPVVGVKSPLDNDSFIPVSGPQQFLFYTLLTGMIMFGYEGLSLNFSAIRLLCWIIFLIFGILFIIKSPIIPSFVILFYALYLVWIVYMGFQSPVKGFAFRNFLKYLFPFLVLIFSMQAQVYKLLFVKYLKFLVGVSLVLLSIVFIRPLYSTFSSLFWGAAAFADYFAILALICVGLYFLIRQKRYILFFFLFASYPFAFSIRTGILATSIGLIFFFIIKYRLKALPIIAIVAVLFSLSILYIPNIKEKMFKEDPALTIQSKETSEYLSTENINTNARQAMWEWSLGKFWENKKMTGSGLGVLQAAFYSGNHPFGKLKMVHNDYIQILCDTGIIGLVIFLSIFIAMVWHCIILYKNNPDYKILQLAALISGSTMAVVMTCSITDNAVNYSLATYCYPYAFYGITLFLNKKKNDQHRNSTLQ